MIRATPFQIGQQAGWTGKLTEAANPYADPADRAQWLDGFRYTIATFERMAQKRAAREAAKGGQA